MTDPAPAGRVGVGPVATLDRPEVRGALHPAPPEEPVPGLGRAGR